MDYNDLHGIERVFLIIGPSGVGKSSALKKIEPDDKILKFNLDSVIREHNGEPSCSKYFDKIGNKAFFDKSIESVNKLQHENHNKTIIIDVGAGSWDWEGSFVKLKKYQSILLTGEKKELHNRIKNRPGETRNLGEYILSEFKSHKEKLYHNATFKIDTTNLDSKMVAEKIMKIVNDACS